VIKARRLPQLDWEWQKHAQHHAAPRTSPASATL